MIFKLKCHAQLCFNDTESACLVAIQNHKKR